MTKVKAANRSKSNQADQPLLNGGDCWRRKTLMDIYRDAFDYSVDEVLHLAVDEYMSVIGFPELNALQQKGLVSKARYNEFVSNLA